MTHPGEQDEIPVIDDNTRRYTEEELEKGNWYLYRTDDEERFPEGYYLHNGDPSWSDEDAKFHATHLPGGEFIKQWDKKPAESTIKKALKT